jgi:hypothetical protein
LFIHSSHHLTRQDGGGGSQGYTKSGDGVVPYASLSWVNTWHYDNVNATDVPANQRVDVDALLSQFGEVRVWGRAPPGPVH